MIRHRTSPSKKSSRKLVRNSRRNAPELSRRLTVERLEDRRVMALLGLVPSFPLIAYNSRGVIDYNAGTDEFEMTALPLAIVLASGDFPGDVLDGDLSVNLKIDNSGSLIGGVPGDDLIITGDVDFDEDEIVDLSGTLLTGEILQFGFLDSGTSDDFYDFRFRVTGGALAGNFAGKDIAITTVSEFSTFTNNFNVNFTGHAKGNVGSVAPLPASLGDRVWRDDNRDGIQDLGEPGIPNIPVRLFVDANQDGQPDTPMSPLQTTLTDGSGLYGFTGLTPGSYVVQFVAEGFTSANVGTEALDSDVVNTLVGLTSTITLVSGEHNPDVDAGLVYSNLGNFVWEDLNANGIQDPLEPGLANVTVDLYDGDGNFLRTTSTDTNGQYVFENLPAGTYQVIFTQPVDYQPSPRQQGGDPEVESDGTESDFIPIMAGVDNYTVDAGFYSLPTITVTKSADVNSVQEGGVGSPLATYTYTVTNDSSVPVELDSITDDNGSPGNPLDDFTPTPSLAGLFNVGDANQNGTIESGEIWQFTYTVALAVANAGERVVNTVSVAGHDPADNVVTGSATATVTYTNVAPSISVDKSHLETIDEGTAGQTLTYVITVTNTSPASTDPVTITALNDPLLGGSLLAQFIAANGGSATLAPNGSASFNVVYNVPVANAGVTIDNTVTADGVDDEGTATNTATDSDQVLYDNVNPAVDITKSANPSSISEAGIGNQTVVYSYTVTNVSPASTDPITITSLNDDLIPGALAAFYAANGNSYVLDPGESVTFTLSQTFAAANAGQIVTNTVTVIAVDDDVDSEPADDSATATVTYADVAPSITVTKSHTGTIYEGTAGQTLTYEFTVENTSVAATDPVTITSLVDPILGGSLLSQFIAANGGSAVLDPGTSVNFEVVYNVPVGNAGTTINNTVTVDGKDDEGTPTNTATASDEAPYLNIDPNVKITKSANVCIIAEGGVGNQTVIYTYKVTNTSQASTDPVTVTSLVDDKIPGALAAFYAANGNSYVLDPGETVTFTLSQVVPVADAGNYYVNTVTVKVRDDDDGSETAQDSACEWIYYADVDPGIQVEKTASSTTAVPGSVITYTYKIENTSAASTDPLTLISLIDDRGTYSTSDDVNILSAGDYVSGDTNGNWRIDKGEVWTFVWCTIMPNIDGTLTNKVKAKGKDDEHNYVEDTDTASVTVAPPGSSTFSGVKFYDLNTNGIRDSGEPTIAGWTIYLYAESNSKPGLQTGSGGDKLLESAPTDADGSYFFEAAVAEVQKITVAGTSGSFKLTFNGKTTAALPYNAAASVVASALNGLTSINSGGGSVKVTRSGTGGSSSPFQYVITFQGSLVGSDVPQITASVASGTPKATVSTVTVGDAPGYGPGTYYLKEGAVPSALADCTQWVQTAPAGTLSASGGTGIYTTTTNNQGDDYVRNFGNVELGEGGGLTLGFWSNKNGKSVLQANEIATSLSSVLSEIQTVKVYGSKGAFTLTYDGKTTSSIAYNASASTVQNALNALSNIGTNGVTVTRTGSGTSSSPYLFKVTFNLKGNHPQLVQQVTSTGVTVSVSTTQNGQAIAANSFTANNWRVALNSLNLRNPDGSVFKVSTTANFHDACATFAAWLLNASATNMANMLSIQLAAMKLNVLTKGANSYGGVNGSSPIHAPQLSSANSAGFVTANQLISEAATELGLHGLTTSSGSIRTYQTKLKDALDDANNNETFVQGGPMRLDGPEAVGAANIRKLSQGELEAAKGAALEHWRNLGVDAAEIAKAAAVPITIVDLPGNALGYGASVGITIDVNGAGHGWYTGVSGGPAAGEVDLLSVLTHEFSHVLGLNHRDDPSDVAPQTLRLGTREFIDDDLVVGVASGAGTNGFHHPIFEGPEFGRPAPVTTSARPADAPVARSRSSDSSPQTSASSTGKLNGQKVTPRDSIFGSQDLDELLNGVC